MARKVILDVDTGGDDAIAIMTAALCPDLEVVGICTTWGNLPIENTTENTLRVVQLLGMDTPVARGASQAMVKTLFPGRLHNPYTPDFVMDENGNRIGYHDPYLPIPAATIKESDLCAVEFYIKALTESAEKITLIPVGPLTNLALAMRAKPSICEKIEQIVIMGGGHTQRNDTASAEFNIWCDPEAAQVVLTSGCDITIVPLDATHRTALTMDHARRFTEMHTPVGDLTAKLIEERITAYQLLQPANSTGELSTPIHDALAVCAVIDPSVLTEVLYTRVNVDMSGGYADGATIVDTREKQDQPKNCHFALDADIDKFADMLVNYLGRFGG